MMTNPITGAAYFFKGFTLINQKGIRRFVLVPLIINILIFSFGLWFAIDQFSIFIEWALGGLPGWLSWLEWLLWPLFAFTFYGLVFFTFSLIANIIAAPFNGPLAAAVERHLIEENLLGEEQNISSNKSFVKEIIGSIVNELIKLKYSVVLMLPLIALSLFTFVLPFISPLVAALWMAYTVWILTLEYADFPMANHGINFSEIKTQLANKRVLSLGFGSAVMLATLIPVVNFLVMPVAVAGATVMYLQEFK